MSGMFVTIHGIDGTGKSTVAQELVGILSERGTEAYYFDDIPLPTQHEDCASYSDFINNDSLKRKIKHSLAVTALSSSGATIVKDRWLIDVCADRSYQGLAIPEEFPSIINPDLSVVLLCAERARQQRIRDRGNPTADDLIPKTSGSRAQYFESYLLDRISDFATEVVVIDTTDLSIPQIVTTIADKAQ